MIRLIVVDTNKRDRLDRLKRLKEGANLEIFMQKMIYEQIAWKTQRVIEVDIVDQPKSF